MKKILGILIGLSIGFSCLAQTPAGFSYQAVLRNSTGQVLGGQTAQLRVTLTSSNGLTTHYQEVHDVTSTAQGLINVVIGNGTSKVGVLADVPWGNDQITMKTEIKVGTATTFTLLGTQPLQAVPYALYANNAKEVESSPTAGDDDPIFVVKNRLGQVVFAVYQEGVRVFVDDGTTKGTKGGFAVGGLSGSKVSDEYFRITRDSARIWVNESAKGAKGGFAVGGLSGAKVQTNNFLQLTPNNYFIGFESGLNISAGLYNSFLGYQAGKLNSNGSWNTFFGYQAGMNNSGSDNTFIGYQAGMVHQNKGGNVYIGSKAGGNALNGERNILVGESAGYGITSGQKNVMIGFESGHSSSTGSFNIFLGTTSGRANAGGSSNVFIGNRTCESTASSNKNVAIGNNCAFDVSSSITSSVIMGDNALTGMVANIPVYGSLFIGNNAGITLGEGSSSVNDCIFLGTNAGEGIKNTEYTTISSIVALGNYSGSQSNGYRNVFIGNGAGSNFVGHQNTMIGFLVGTQGGSGTYNVYLGDQCALQANGDNNTYIGRTSGNWVNGSNNIFLGYGAGAAVYGSPRTESNRLRIGASNLIYGEFDNSRVAINATDPTQTLDVNGNARFRSVGSGAYAGVLNRTADGTLTTSTSDVRLKEGISTLKNSLSKVLTLRGVNFTWKSNPEMGNRIGFIAQEMELVFPELVFTNETDGYKGVNYAEMSAVLVEAIKEQQKIIEELRSKNAELENKVNEIDNLKAELESIKKLITK